MKTSSSSLSYNSNARPFCPIHNPQASFAQSNPLSYSICMMRNCSKPYQILCPACKNSHNSHPNKLIGVAELRELTEKLVQKPFNKVKQNMFDLVNMMDALQWIQCFKSEMDHMLIETRKQTMELIKVTEKTIAQYANCKSAAHLILQDLVDLLEKPRKQGKNPNPTFDIIEELQFLEYNNLLNQLQFGSPGIREDESNRKSMLSGIKKKIDEIRAYGLKIVQIVLTSEIIDDIEEEDIEYSNTEQKQKIILLEKKKQYQRLKRQLEAEIIKNTKPNTPLISQLKTPSTSLELSADSQDYRTNFNFNLIIGSIQNNQIYNGVQAMPDSLSFAKQIQQKDSMILKKCEEALKEYQKKFMSIEGKIKSIQQSYNSKVEHLQKTNEKLTRQNQRMVKQFKQRIKTMKQYEKQLQMLKSQHRGKLLRTNSPQKLILGRQIKHKDKQMQ